MANNFIQNDQNGLTFGFRFSPHAVYNFNKFSHATGNRGCDSPAAREAIPMVLGLLSKLNPRHRTLHIKGFLLFESVRPDGSIAYNHVVDVEGGPEIMTLLALTDVHAMAERNGVLYQYMPAEGVSVQKTFHISLGPDQDGTRRACFKVGDELVITQAFIKLEGPHDPFFVIDM